MTEPDESAAASLRVPPHSTESEQSVLGGLLIDGDAFSTVAAIVAAADFYRHEHRLIFDAIGTMVAAGQVVDVVTVFQRLQDGAGNV